MTDSKALDTEEVSTETEMLKNLDCRRSKRRCEKKKLLAGLGQQSKAATTGLLNPVLSPHRALQVGSYLNNTIKSSTFQISRSWMSNHEAQIKCQEAYFFVQVKSIKKFFK